MRKSHKKDFQVSYQTLLFMAKLKEYAFDCCSMSEEAPYDYYNESLNDKAASEAIRCANFAWRLLEEEDRYIPIISDIQHIIRRLH